MPTTPEFGWTTPTVGGDTNEWGQILNDLFDEIDSEVYAISDRAFSSLPLKGGKMTGPIGVPVKLLGNISGPDVHLKPYEFNDADQGCLFVATVTGNVSIAIDLPAHEEGLAFAFALRLTNGGAFTTDIDVNGFANPLNWPGGVGPNLTASGTDLLGFIAYAGPSFTWTVDGFMIGKDLK